MVSVRLWAFVLKMSYEDLIHAEMCNVASPSVKKNAPPNVRNLRARQSEIEADFELAGYEPTLGGAFQVYWASGWRAAENIFPKTRYPFASNKLMK